MTKVTVIIPFLNEEDNVPTLVRSLNSFFESNASYDAEVIFVNDGSTDGSVRLLKAQEHRSYRSKLISLSRNFGSHAALRAGIMAATGDYITFIYADLQDPLSLIDQMYKTLTETGSDIVWATRRGSTGPLSKSYSRLMKRFVNPQYPENGFDVMLFKRKVASLLNANVEGNSSIFLQILTLGFKQQFISYDKQARHLGKSKWTIGKKIKLFIDSFIAFSYAPIRFVTTVGIFLFIAGMIFSGYLIVRKLLYNDLVSGWPMLMSILMFGFGITNISLGIIAEYLWRTLDTSRRRPVYIIDEILELNSDGK